MSSVILLVIAPAFVVVAARNYVKHNRKQPKRYRRTYNAWNRSRGHSYQ